VDDLASSMLSANTGADIIRKAIANNEINTFFISFLLVE
jgi:hypothetical protein